ncbi:hypothetical protein ACTHGU_03180 [Chitinophagaceae bacterium MMS25-I14]
MKRILAYSIFALGILLIVFFRAYEGDMIPYPVVFIIIGLLMMVVSYIILRRLPQLKAKHDYHRLMLEISDLKARGDRLKVNLAACEVKDSSYFEEQEPASGTGMPEGITDLERYVQVFNALKGPFTRPAAHEVYQSVLVYKCMYNGRQLQFISRIIPKDKTSVLFWLDNQKETVLYVDKTNPSRYFFDLDFFNSDNAAPAK